MRFFAGHFQVLLTLFFLLRVFLTASSRRGTVHNVPRNLVPEVSDEPFPEELRRENVYLVRELFAESMNGYMTRAFPHDELKPVTGTWTDSLPELGNGRKADPKLYQGMGLTLIDALDSLVLFAYDSDDDSQTNTQLPNSTQMTEKCNRNATICESAKNRPEIVRNESSAKKWRKQAAEHFGRAIEWLNSAETTNLFNGSDVRVHVFESTIRVLGGLISAHSVCSDWRLRSALLSDDKSAIGRKQVDACREGVFLRRAEELGSSLMRAFQASPSALPYAWVNLLRGVKPTETTETCTAAATTLVLELGALSYYSGNASYFLAAHRSLRAVFGMRHADTGLVANGIRLGKYQPLWSDTTAGIGAGIDSFYEYLLKGHIFIGDSEYWNMFSTAYRSALALRLGVWYPDSHWASRKPKRVQFNSLQAFWPTLQVLIGDLPLAVATIDSVYALWLRFGALPERVLLNGLSAHSTERQWPLRPELLESLYYAHTATGRNRFLWMAHKILSDLAQRCRVMHGVTMLKDVTRKGEKARGDYMPSFFVAETLKYLLLLFDDKHAANWPSIRTHSVFTTEGHLLPLAKDMHQFFSDALADAKADDLHTSTDSQLQWKGVDQTSAGELTQIKNDLKGNYNSGHFDSVFLGQTADTAQCLRYPFAFHSFVFDRSVYNEWLQEEDASDEWQKCSALDTPHFVRIESTEGLSPESLQKLIQNKGQTFEMPVRGGESEEGAVVRVGSGVGQFSVEFLTHFEELEVLNLGSERIEILGAVPMASSFSRFAPRCSRRLPPAMRQSEFKEAYFTETAYIRNDTKDVPYKYELKIESEELRQCFVRRMAEVLFSEKQSLVVDEKGTEVRIPMTSSNFGPIPEPLTKSEIGHATGDWLDAESEDCKENGEQKCAVSESPNNCRIERVLANGLMVFLAEESTTEACSARHTVFDTDSDEALIGFVLRGGCTFYEKVTNAAATGLQLRGVVVGNHMATVNAFTLGSDAEQQFTDFSSHMIDTLAFDSLRHCGELLPATARRVAIVELHMRCAHPKRADLNVHGSADHFAIDSFSNHSFFVSKTDNFFRLAFES